MAKKLMSWKTKGMNRDLSVSAFNPEFAFENKNLRLGTNESNTMLSWVNEKGTSKINLVPGNWIEDDESTKTSITRISGTPIGTAVIEHQLVLFTTVPDGDTDFIYVLKYSDATKTTMLCKQLYSGNLNFKVEYPIETLISYESEMIQKVYWTDGLNQPRIININGKIKDGNITQFDFIPTLKLKEKVSVEKMLGATGMFAPGVIQYAFTYYNKYGQESNIFYVTPLYYISYRERGASPEDKVENAFRITVEKVDSNFDYLRIYSIQRTSIDGTPICKRIQDIEINDLDDSTASYIDIGTSGDSVDPAELFYKGGETISALTLEQKDNTLFLGNIHITRPQIVDTLKTNIQSNFAGVDGDLSNVSQSSRKIKATSVSTGSYVYSNQLTAISQESRNYKSTVPCAGFKYGDVYRLGVQFQYETGKWSDPIWIGDQEIKNKPSLSQDDTVVSLPTLKGTLSSSNASALLAEGYRKIRALVVFPGTQDRNIICQGVVNSTLYTQNHRSDNDLYAQSSWFFRASNGRKISGNTTCSPTDSNELPYTHRGIKGGVPVAGCYNYNPAVDPENGSNIRLVEVQGDFDSENRFNIDKGVVTFHSPDVEFDNQLSLMDYSGSKFRQVGHVIFSNTMSDIDIQTETPTASNMGGGFVHKSFSEINTYGIVAGLFYDDFCLDDNDAIEPYTRQKSSFKWMVYPWQRNGALNNDINRPADKGQQSATLKKKVISNLRFANTTFDPPTDSLNYADSGFPRMFDSDEVQILKIGSKIYKGNVDTLLIPDNADGDYFAFDGLSDTSAANINTKFNSISWWKTFSKDATDQNEQGLYKYLSTGWDRETGDIGDDWVDLVIKKGGVRMKYKSTPHLAFAQTGNIIWNRAYNNLPVIEITQESGSTRFGGTSMDALKENTWIPAGEPVSLVNGPVEFFWDYGDTYYQRYDCLKTFPFTHDDVNQIVEIGSFMLETRVNIDGRYDRNRGQMNNLNMSPTNFNLLNSVYSQINNFFSYKIQDDDYYINVSYPNQITWSKSKQSSADVDMWTNITLASVLELDGDKGEVVSLKRTNNQLVCFQNLGISRLLYNENFMVSTQEGVPVEIANTGKVEGKTYISSMVGCANRWSIVATPTGLYFTDNNEKELYLLSNEVSNISTPLGFSSWAKKNVASSGVKWNPTFPLVNGKSAIRSVYDKINQEILFIHRDTCLAYSEKFGAFTSFYDYNNTPFFCNLDDTGVWIKDNTLWKHQAGEYCNFFGTNKPYSMTLIGNMNPQVDKTFTNLEFRAIVDGDGTMMDGADIGTFDETFDYTFHPGAGSHSWFQFFLPFDSLEVWNEYQHGIASLSQKNGREAMQHNLSDGTANLNRKFRMWRCDIPRNNYPIPSTDEESARELELGVFRKIRKPMDRMRNPWLYLKLYKDATINGGSNKRTEIHDIVMTYFD